VSARYPPEMEPRYQTGGQGSRNINAWAIDAHSQQSTHASSRRRP
jgi:hypothetical protein